MHFDSFDLDWTLRAKRIQTGNHLLIWITAHTGYIFSWTLLCILSLFYTLFDFRAKRHIKEFRKKIGEKTTIKDYYHHFFNFGSSLIDRYSYMFGDDNTFTYQRINENMITDQLGTGTGVLLLGAHLGDWQMAGSVLNDSNLSTVNLLRYDVDSLQVKELLTKVKKRGNINFITISEKSPSTMIEIINALKRGEIVCLLGDRVLGNQQCERLLFFKEFANFPKGPFSLAAVTQVPVIPFFSVKTAFKKYSFIAYEPIFVEYSNQEQKASAISDAMKRYVKILEGMVRKYPYQWYNYYKFWL